MENKIPCLIYSRVVGYYSPTIQWNKSKKEEFNDRKVYKLPEGLHETYSESL
jgi:anaerobic ribonucleoside-triphosphate reductase